MKFTVIFVLNISKYLNIMTFTRKRELISSLSKSMKGLKTRKKFKIIQKPVTCIRDFRLFDFQTFDTKRDEYNEAHFRIQMFGINEEGETCAFFVDDYQPFFYVKIPQSWNQNKVNEWFNHLANLCTYNKKNCISAKIEKHSKLYEFTGDKSFLFAKCVFRTISAFYQFKSVLQQKKHKKPVYESKIPPLLRYFHIHNISPSGWIQINEQDTEVLEEKITTCNYEFKCSIHDIKPLPSKETPVPYKIASFDIEASSSHGDFPLPIKDYKRMATQLVDLLQQKIQKQDLKLEGIQMLLKKAILGSFGYGVLVDGVDVVYTKTKLTKEKIKETIQKLLSLKLEQNITVETNATKINEIFENIASMQKSEASGSDDSAPAAGGNHFVVQDFAPIEKKAKMITLTDNQKTQTICEFLLSKENSRETKIQTLNSFMSKESMFPSLRGDEITFIGTTFLKYGTKEPYRSNCLVVGSCDDVSGMEICTVKNERECLMEWTQLIQDENPDIIIGYNIFGFDYQFMFQRAKELCCVDEFCTLSRIQNEICHKTVKDSTEVVLDHTQNRLASGDYDLHYPPISGRLQIDLLFYFRRDYNLSSYKLDDVAGTMIRDDIKIMESLENGNTQLYSKNLAGLHKGDFIHLEITSFTTDYYAGGKKFRVLDIQHNVMKDNVKFNIITIEGHHTDLDPKKQTLKWGMAKDDVSPQDIFRLSKESSTSRAIVAKYCIQDCNLVHHLMNKVDVLTGYIEMARICNVPISFLVFRGQGIKLTSYVAKVCREKRTLMPDLEKTENDDGYEGAIVLPPKCAMYGENPVACNDYSSLYPSIAKGWNLSPNSKVWTKNYDLNGNLVKINDVLVTTQNHESLLQDCDLFDNLPDYQYIEVTFDSYEQVQRHLANGNLGRKDKIKSGTKVVRWAQFPKGQEGIIPCIIGDLLKARKETRKKAQNEPDPFLANVLDKRQLGYKVTANSLYGQMGSSVSTFFEKDVAASITAIGRMMITYAKRMVEEIYANSIYTDKNGRTVRTRSAYVYGDTDSVFFTFNLEDPVTGSPIRGKEALEWTIEIAEESARLCSMFLPPPMKLEYEKTLMSFILLSKKRYVGMLYEHDPNKGKLKFMGLPLKRRDACDYLKDVYGGILTILMKEPDNVQKAIEFLNTSLRSLTDGNVSMDKLALTKSLRSDYKNPQQIAHKVLADRIGEREPGNKPKPGERIKYVFIENKDEKLLGNRVETPQFILQNKLKLDYHYYITNQLMNPLLQLFSLAVDKVYLYKGKKQSDIVKMESHLDQLFIDSNHDLEIYMKKREKHCSSEVKQLLFDPFLNDIYNSQNGIQTLFQFYRKT